MTAWTLPRAATLLLFGGLMGLGCVSSSPPSTTAVQHRAVRHRAATAPPDRPQTDEDRANLVLEELADFCTGHAAECGATADPDRYPDTAVPEAERRYVDDHRQELQSLGVEVRWDPGSGRFELTRGTTPTVSGNPADDP